MIKSFFFGKIRLLEKIERDKMTNNIKLFLRGIAKVFEVPDDILPLYKSEIVLAIIGIVLFLFL